MRRLTLLLLTLTLLACGHETKQPETATTAKPPAPPVTTSTAPPKMTTMPPTAEAPKLNAKSCGGDGSYGMAVDCFRIAAAEHFTIDEGSLRVEGELARPNVGAELVHFTAHGAGVDGEWIGAAKPSGVLWYRDRKRVTNEPLSLARLYQRITLFLDPQKKEGQPQLAGVEMMGGESSNHYRFTDANNGSKYDVWVSKSDGGIVQMHVDVPAAFRGAFPSYTLTLPRNSAPVSITEPR